MRWEEDEEEKKKQKKREERMEKMRKKWEEKFKKPAKDKEKLDSKVQVPGSAETSFNARGRPFVSSRRKGRFKLGCAVTPGPGRSEVLHARDALSKTARYERWSRRQLR